MQFKNSTVFFSMFHCPLCFAFLLSFLFFYYLASLATTL